MVQNFCFSRYLSKNQIFHCPSERSVVGRWLRRAVGEASRKEGIAYSNSS
ncbi:hypothetical protein LC653_34315 [Nostoc sp. CHAB 5784]|nr:hypothetical protein [Nostoc mirabile]MCC5668794.1 hypothetical protein [Nostoc mirabile CHAB5784]